jgi:hypothetical protein
MGDDVEGSKKLVLKLYGDELGPKLAYAAGYGRGYNYRKVLEPTDATSQCENTGHPFKAGMLCYMCGNAIPAKKSMSGAGDELWPECEHILPLTEGRWLLDIYMTNRIQTDLWSQKARTLEYDYAHRVCNQAKGMDSYIETKADGTVAVSDAKIKGILTAVKQRAANDVAKGDKRPMMTGIRDMDVNARTEAIQARVQALVDHINKAPFNTPEGQGLVVLMKAALFVDPESLVPAVKKVHDAWYKEATGRNATYAANLAAFINQTEAAYPVLASNTERVAYLTKLVARDDDERLEHGFVASVVPPIDAILKTIFDKTSKDEDQIDPSGAHFLSLVTYGMYAALYTQLVKVNDRRTERLRCELVARMARIAGLPITPSAVSLFGTVPVPKDARACAVFAGADARAERAYLAAIDEGTLAETAETIVEGLSRGLDATAGQFGVNVSGGAKTDLLTYAKKCVLTHLTVFPENTYESQIVGARAIAENPKTSLLLIRNGFTSEQYQAALFKESAVFARGAARRRTTYRRKSKRRKTLRKRVRA